MNNGNVEIEILFEKTHKLFKGNALNALNSKKNKINYQMIIDYGITLIFLVKVVVP
jgi:hypothetical protein